MGLDEVTVTALDPGRLRTVLTPEALAAFEHTLTRGRELLESRTLWNVNSTAHGGGVAEMLRSLIGYTRGGGSEARWLVIEGDGEFLFVVLFGLSMDYQVLILSRVREGHDRGMSTEDAVADGIKSTAGVVTSAAIVMVAVFAIFATLEMIEFKMMGVGLAAAILIDATIVRAVLVPSAMKLLGNWNWYLPRWLEWLPRVTAEPLAAPTPAPALAPSALGRPIAAPARPVRRHLSLHRR